MHRFLVAALAAPLLALPVASPAQAACTRTPSDFNGDGYGDVAIGAPGKTTRDTPRVGAVHVAYGSASTLVKGVTIDAWTPGIPRRGNWGSSYLGEALADGYFDDDCYADLVASASGGDEILVLYGSADGLTGARSKLVAHEDLEPSGVYGAGLGRGLATGDFNGDGRDDIAAGAPNNLSNVGAFAVLYGSSEGITTTGSQWVTQDTPSVPETAEDWDLFGDALAAGDFDGDGKADLAVGAPGDSINAWRDAGGVIVFRGTDEGLSMAGSQWWSQYTAGVPDNPETNDGFGGALAAGDTNGDGRADLMVGAHGETIGAHPYAGLVQVFLGAATGLTAGRAFDQSSATIPDAAEDSDYFGRRVALTDLDRDGRSDLVVGIPGESVGNRQNTGAITVLYSGASGPSDVGATYFDQNSLGVAGANENWDNFGTGLTGIAQHYGGDALVVGIDSETITLEFEGAVTVIRGGARGASRPEGQFLSGANFLGGAGERANFGFALS